MSYELMPRTEAGKRFVEAAEGIILPLRAQALDTGDMPKASFQLLTERGIVGAFLPESEGGFGLTSVHDWMAGMSRLGRGDGSVAIAVNMHLGVSRGLSGAFSGAKSAGNEVAVAALRAQFKKILSGEMYICATATEPGTDNLHPFTEATEVEDGWRIDGLKIFVTGSPLASHIAMNLREGDTISSVIMPIDTKGVMPLNDWQALGMKGSGSQSIKFENVVVPKHLVSKVGPWGQWTSANLMSRNLGNAPLVAVFLGIAEHAFELTVSHAKTSGKKGKPTAADIPGVQHAIAEMEIKLSACRALVAQMGQMSDDFLEQHKGKKVPIEAAHELLKDHQSMKWVVNRDAIAIVDQAMDVVGGSGFMDKHPLSRLYRDVRAGPFMQPFSRTEAKGYIGRVVLGDYPEN